MIRRSKYLEPESKYFLNANFLHDPTKAKKGHYNVDEKGEKCYGFSKDIEEQHMGKPQMTCTFDITFLKRLYRFIIDNKAFWKEGNSHLKYKKILKVSGAILHHFEQYIKKFGQKLSKEIEYYEGIFIYLLTYYIILQLWEESYFKAQFSFKLRTNPVLFLKTDDGIIYEFSKWLLDVISENGKVYIEFIKRCCESKKEVLYIKNHPILPDRYFDQEFATSDQAEIMELLDGKFERVYYCNPSGEKKENKLGKIGLSKVIKGKLVFDADSVEVFDWPPENERRISIECRSFQDMIYLSYRKLLAERLYNFELEDIKINEENDEKTDKDIERIIEEKSEAYRCDHLYSLIKLLFKYIFSEVFKGEKNFVFGIEFETSLLIYSLVYNDRKPIWERNHHSGPRVTVTTEIVQTVKKHLPYKDGKYYDCYGDYAAYTVDNPNDALRCIYALEGQIGTFTVDLSQPDYDLTIVKECIDWLCVFITTQKMDPKTFVEKIFKCSEEERRNRSRSRSPRPNKETRHERERTPSRFNSKKSKKTPKKTSKKTPKKTSKTSKKTSKKTPKKSSKTSKKTSKKKSKKTSKKKSKKTSKKKSKKTPKKINYI